MFDNLYNQIYVLGLQTIRYGKRFFKWVGALLLKPFKALFTLLFTFLIVVDKFALRVFHEIVDDFKELVSEIKRASASMVYIDEKGKKKRSFKKLGAYLKKGVRQYKRALVYVLNIALPILSLVMLLNIVSWWSNMTFALELTYEDEVIGYVRTEADYKEAREMALERLSVFATESGEPIEHAEYKIKPIKLTQLSDANAICDKLIENSDYNITNACGIYIDGDFLCAVKNETDALSVFDNYIAEYEEDVEDAVVSFVEEIEYVQGLYPDDDRVIRDAEYLTKKLNSKKSEAQYYTVADGDTIIGIANKFNITVDQLEAYNPDYKEGSAIHIGDVFLVATEVRFIRVQLTKTEVREETVKYDTIKINTDTLYVGDKKVIVKGVNGLDKVTELVTYVDGVKVSVKEVGRETIKEPIDCKIQVGTKNSYAGNVGNPFGGTLCWPAVGCYVVSSPYGYRNYGDGFHGGIDLVRRGGGSSGSTVVAAEAGTVIYAGWDKWGGGYTVKIDHGGGMVTWYSHMQAGSIAVSKGQKVTRGQAVGRVGDTGNVTGPHLHFEVRINGNTVNPAPFLGI